MVNFFKYPKRHLKKLIKDGEYVEAIKLGKSLESKFSDDYDLYDEKYKKELQELESQLKSL